MTSATELRPARPSAIPIDIVQATRPCPELNRFLYTAVGTDWWWYSRLPWDRARWLAYLDRPELETWVAYVSGAPAGYFELERQEAGNVEITYFGVFPGFIGKGLGGQLLTAAVRRAWATGPARVWVHTCDLDHPAALANYQARGFKIFLVESKLERLPDAPLEVWAGANG
jgi:GNAT superfamily N-acetyltransferase